MQVSYRPGGQVDRHPGHLLAEGMSLRLVRSHTPNTDWKHHKMVSRPGDTIVVFTSHECPYDLHYLVGEDTRGHKTLTLRRAPKGSEE